MSRGRQSSVSPDRRPSPAATPAGQSVLLGFHAIRARLRAAPETIRRLLVDQQRKDVRSRDLLKEAEQAGVKVELAATAVLDDLSRGERHQGALALADRRSQPDDLPTLLEALEARRHPPGLLLFLDGVTDPHNLGAILRSSDATAVDGVVAPKDHSAPLTDVAIRVSAGGSETVPYLQVTNLSRAIEQAQDAGFQVIGLDGEGEQMLTQADLTGPVVLVLGAEGAGMRRLVKEHCDQLAALPMLGQVESLNVSVTAGVVLYEVLRQRSSRKA